MRNDSKGGRMSPELTALVHWTVGRCASATPLEAVKLSSDLITQIQQELTNSYREGIAAVRRVTPHGSVPQGGGGNGSWSDPDLATIASGIAEATGRDVYVPGAAV